MTANFQHPLLAAGKWFTLSLSEQLGNIGSEVHRVILARGDTNRCENAILRAFELFYLTLLDQRWKNRRKEIVRAREIFCDALLGGKEYGSTLEDLDNYFFHFAMAARIRKHLPA